MRLMTGGTLADELDKGPVSLSRARWLIGQIVTALAYAHARGVIHRDLKPENILLDEGSNAYLTDFGIAKMLGGKEHLTRTGHLLGTPSYMAPEQWRSQPVDARTDVYALGIILYEMLVGVQAFDAETPYDLMVEHLDKQPPSPIRYHPELPSAVEPIIFKAIAKDPADRYASVLELSEALIQVVARAHNPDYRPTRPAKRFPTIQSGTQLSYDDSTHQLPIVRPAELPDWAKRLAGAPPTPGSKDPVPPIQVPPARKPTAPPPAQVVPQRPTAAPAREASRPTAAPASVPPRAPGRAEALSGVHPAATTGGGGRRWGGRKALLGVLGLIVLVVVVIVVVLVAGSGDKEKATSTATPAVIVTPSPAATATATESIPTPTETPVPTETRAVITILTTETPIPTEAPEVSPTPIAFLIPSLRALE
jgi:hypothetical protein